MTLIIPDELNALIRDGIWPCDEKSARQQNLKPIIPAGIIRLFAPEQDSLCLYPPPFCTVHDEVVRNGFWRNTWSALHEIDLALALLIGDFGLGSDAPIILDYRSDPTLPKVLRLCWAKTGNHWVECTPTFSEFARYLRGNGTGF